MDVYTGVAILILVAVAGLMATAIAVIIGYWKAGK